MLESVVSLARTGYTSDSASVLNVCLLKIQHSLRATAQPQQLLQNLTYSFETVVLMQQQGDWVGLADVVQYELTGLVAELES